jgi:hypothetical protein
MVYGAPLLSYKEPVLSLCSKGGVQWGRRGGDGLHSNRKTDKQS